MAGSSVGGIKNYIVNYNINANTSEAVQGLQLMADKATAAAEPLAKVESGLRQIARYAQKLAASANTVFTPSIETSTFKIQLREMVEMVDGAANEMRAAINSAMRGTNGQIPKSFIDVRDKAFSEKLAGKTKSQLSTLLKEENKSLRGLIKEEEKWTKELNQNPNSKRAKAEQGLAKRHIQEAKDRISQIENAKLIAPTTIAPSPKPVVEKPAASDTAYLKQWHKTFGDKKSATLKLNATATGALKTIRTVQTALNGLHEASKLTIIPTVDPTALATAKDQLGQLATAGGKNVKVIQKPKGKGGATSKDAAAKPMVVDVVGNVTSITKPTTELIVPIVGEVTKIVSKVSEAIPLKATISTGSITESIKAMKRPTIPVAMKLMWEKGAIGRQEQLKGIQSKIPPIKLILDPTEAVAKLEEFIGQIKASSPQNIKLTASGTAAGKTGTTGAAAGNGKGTTGAMPLTPRQYRDQLGKHLSKGFSLPSNYANQITEQQRTRAWQLAAMRNDAISAFAQETPYEKQLKSLVPTTAGKGADQVVWGKKAPAWNTAAPGMKWVANNNLEKFLSPEQKQELRSLQGVQAYRNQKFADMQSRIAQTRAQIANNPRPLVYDDALNQQLAPLHKQLAQLEELKKPLLALKKPNATQKNALARINDTQAQTAAQIQQHEQAALLRQQADRMARFDKRAKRAAMVEQRKLNRANAAVNQYTSGWSQVKKPIGTPSDWAIKKVMGYHNTLLSFGLNEKQMKLVNQHRRFFFDTQKASGITLTKDMPLPQLKAYLQDVSGRMRSANVPVPVQLQAYMDKLDKKIAKASAGGGTKAAYPPVQRTPFERFRKWGAFFSGPSSFGARTPMAVDMAKGMGVMFAIGGAMSAIGGSFSQAMEYQNTMQTAKTILQNSTDTYSESSFKNMEETVREVGVKTKFSAPEVASAAKFLAMAGYDIDGINAAIRPIADLALLGDSDLGETADKMTNILTTFGIDADKIKANPEIIRQYGNIMATTATRTNTDLMMLAESAKYGGGVANMYGRNDPNLFADTMAIFGVMGNAGIQASSAGTSLRMMYQNIFNPNKKQQKLLDMLKDVYKITTKTEDGQNKSMADFIIELANKVDDDVLPDIVGKLFRITAQPGANAALLSAVDIAMQESGGDSGTAQSLVDETNAFVSALSDKKKGKKKISTLAKLIQANRDSVNSDLLGIGAEAKQSTIQGLWAQVTSTFTEGIVQAFEQRQGGFEGMLKDLRDYLAKPETVRMLQKLLDLVVAIGKVMAWFVELWAKLYSAAPDLVRYWVQFQMIWTQFGSLILPITGLLGVFYKLGDAIAWLNRLTSATVATAGGARAAAAVGGGAAASAANAAMYAPLAIGRTKVLGRTATVNGHFAAKMRKQMEDNALLAASLYPANKTAAKELLDSKTRAHAMAVRARARRIDFFPRIARGFKSGFNATLSMAVIAPIFHSILKGFTKLMASLAKALGWLVGPTSLAVTGLTTLGIGIYKFIQHINGNSTGQKETRKQANKAIEQSAKELEKETQWYSDLLGGENIKRGTVRSSTNQKAIEESNAQKSRIQSAYAGLLFDFSNKASYKTNNDILLKWNRIKSANPLFRIMLDDLNVNDFDKNHVLSNNALGSSSAAGGWTLYNAWNYDKDKANSIRLGMVQEALKMEALMSPEAKTGVAAIAKLRQQYHQKEITEQEYLEQASAVKQRILGTFSTKLPANNMTPEQFKKSPDYSIYDVYQNTLSELLENTIIGATGTVTGKYNAYQWLEQHKDNKAFQFGKQWYDSIANVINDYRVTYNAITKDGKVSRDLEIMLSMLPDKNYAIDFDSVIAQIKSANNNFTLTLQGYTDMIATVFKMLAESGYLKIDDFKTFKGLIREKMAGAKYGEDSYRKYYQEWIKPQGRNSEWIQADIGEDAYVDFMMGRSGDTIKTSKRTVSREKEQEQFYKNLADASGRTVWDGIQEINNNPKITPTDKNPGTDQLAYASHYDKGAARPAVVNINIGEFAHFDRTTVSSSAEERDLMAAMEPKMVEALYRMFATASNQVQNVMQA